MPAIGATFETTTSGLRAQSGVKVLLRGNILNNGGLAITGRGFHYGPTIAMGKTAIVSSLDDLFSLQIKVKKGEFFWQAYATNADGESVANIESTIIV